ncbi:MAG: hypothetical protein EZS28_038688, partial [Streblomastix strix]
MIQMKKKIIKRSLSPEQLDSLLLRLSRGERIILSPQSQIQLSKQKYENLPEVVERKKKEKKEKDLAEFRMNAKLIAE